MTFKSALYEKYILRSFQKTMKTKQTNSRNRINIKCSVIDVNPSERIFD
jgi:hypothetical protein